MYKKISLSILILAIIYLCAAWYFSSTVLHLSNRICNQDHYVYCDTPDQLSLEYQDITFKTIDNLVLPAWYMPSGTSVKTIILVHGRGASRHEGMRYAKSLVGNGYNVLAIDLRHPRQQKDIISSMSFYERRDIYAALDYLQEHTSPKAIGVMGFSMGASTSIIAMAEDNRIQAGIFNSGYANSTDVLAENAKAMYSLPRYPLMPAVMALVGLRGDIDVDLINPESYISKISPRPIYIMHGTADTTVGFHHGERLFAAAKQPKTFWQVDGGEHTRLWQADKNYAETSVVEFFNHNL